MRFWRDVGEAMTEAFRKQLWTDDARIYYEWCGYDPDRLTFWAMYR